MVRPRVSLDGGRTWSTIALNFGPDSYVIDPSVAFDASGTAYLAAAASNGSNGRLDVVVSRSTDGGFTWSSPVRVAAGSGSAGAGVSNDHPQLTATGSGTILLTWIRSLFTSGGTFVDSPVYDAVSHDGGDTWSAPTSISGSAPFCTGVQASDACDLAYGNAVVMTPTEAVVAFQDTYQDSPDGSTNLGRNKHMVVTVDPVTGTRTRGPYLVGQAYDGIDEQDFPVDARGLQTLQDSQLNLDLDGGLAADPTDPGHLAVTWYDDRNAPHPVNSDPYQATTNADIVISQSFDGGQTWSTPTTISQANDQFMPAMVYDPSGRLRVGFYDRSYDPANHAYGYTLATETGKRTLKFTTQEITTALSDPTRGAVGLGFTINSDFPNPALGIGDYTALALTPTSLDAYWTDMRRTVCENGQCGSTEDAFFASVPLRSQVSTYGEGFRRGGELVEEAHRLVRDAEDVLRLAVAAERGGGVSWETIGEALQITRQSAHERYAQPVDEILDGILFPERENEHGGPGWWACPDGLEDPDKTLGRLDQWAVRRREPTDPDRGPEPVSGKLRLRREKMAGVEAIGMVTRLARRVAQRDLPVGVSESIARRLLLEHKVRAFDLIAERDTGATATKARAEAQEAYEQLMRCQ